MKFRTLLVVIALAVAAAACSSGTGIDRAGPMSEYGLGVGDCFDDPPDFEYDASAMIATPCSQPHDNEIYAIGTFSGSSYPTDVDPDGLADDFCLEQFEGFIGIPWDESIYDYIWIIPERGDWDSGERDVLCAVYDLDLRKLIGSLERIGE